MISKKKVSILDSKINMRNSIIGFHDMIYQPRGRGKNKRMINNKKNSSIDDIINVISYVFVNIYIGDNIERE